MSWLEEHEDQAEGHLLELALLSQLPATKLKTATVQNQHGHHHSLADQLRTGQYQDIQDGALGAEDSKPSMNLGVWPQHCGVR